MNANWKDCELAFCRKLCAKHGSADVGHDPKDVAAYLRLQSASAYRDGEIEISARLGVAATAINCDARNDHEPHWTRAVDYLTIGPAMRQT